MKMQQTRYLMIFLIISFLLLICFLPQQIADAKNTLDIEWNTIFGGTGNNTILNVTQTVDSGYAYAGFTDAYGKGGSDCWLVKTRPNGSVEWHTYYGGPNNDIAYSLVQTINEEYVLAGYTTYDDGSTDLLIINTDKEGEIQWYQTYDYSHEDRGTSLIQNNDNNYVIAGFTLTPDENNYDILLLKINGTGNQTWQKSYGGSSDDKAWSVIQTSDGGFAIAGQTASYGSGGYDFWLVKTDQNGTMQWNRTYGGTDDDVAYSFVQTSDNGFVLVGYTISYGSGRQDFWLVKTDQNGTMQWNRTYGGKDDDVARTLIQTNDGGFTLVGYSERIFYYNYYLVKTNPQGFKEWDWNYSWVNNIFALTAIQDKNYNIVIGGYTQLDYNNTRLFSLQTSQTEEGKYNLAPVANAGIDVLTNKSTLISFEGQGYDPDGIVIDYRWDFNGDGIYDYESNITGNTNHSFDRSGTYRTFFQVTDNNGSSSTDMKTILVRDDASSGAIISIEVILRVLISLVFLCITIIYMVLKEKNYHCVWITDKIPRFIVNTDKWIKYLLLSFFSIFFIKLTISLLFTTPIVFLDEFIYGSLAKDISSGVFSVIGHVPFSTASVPTGYPLILAPAYLISNDMTAIYHVMLFINCIISAFIIFPVFFIMKHFTNEKFSFITSILVVSLPTIVAHTYLLMSENAFYLMFLISCFFLIKTYTYNKFDKKFILYSLLLGFSLILLIMIRAMGVAMVGSAFCVFIFKLFKERKLSTFRYSLIFLPFLPALGYLVYKSGGTLLGYPSSGYFNSISLVFSNTEYFTRFIYLILTETSYFFLMSYIIFVAFTVLLFIHWKNLPEDKKPQLFLLSFYGLLSTFLLILITAVHMLLGPYTLYTRYENAGLPIIFMLGIIGLLLFEKIKNRKIIFHFCIIILLSILLTVFVFPENDIKFINSIDVAWVVLFNSISIYNITLFTLTKIILLTLSIVITSLLLFKFRHPMSKLSSKKNHGHMPNIKLLFSIVIVLSIIFSSLSIIYLLNSNKILIYQHINDPGLWLMENEHDAHIIMEADFAAYSGGGMQLSDWQSMFGITTFWSYNNYIEAITLLNLSKAVESGSLDADYILSTHDLTAYYPSVQNFEMNLPVAPIKSQHTVDWHIYKIK